MESLGFVLPNEVVTSEDLEARLEPLYSRLKLPAGRLELMTGIQARRFWAPGVLPGDISILAGRAALEAGECDGTRVGLLIHASVCRDHLEPATSCRVHHALGLPSNCQIYDVSNACLGMLNGMVQAANMIELGQIQAALVVGTEGSRQLVENTIAWMNSNHALTRQQVKLAVASLTIGSASAAVLLVDASISRTGNHLHTATWHAATEHHMLCHSGQDEAAADGMTPLMTTDSERLLEMGIAAGRTAFKKFLEHASWQGHDIDRAICHQVGAAHRKLMMESLGISAGKDFVTFPTLGNTGSAALPITLALAADSVLEQGDRLALLGIGSGINVMMLGLDWRGARVASMSEPRRETPSHSF